MSKQINKEKTVPIRVRRSLHRLIKQRAAFLGISMVDLLENFITDHPEMLEVYEA